MVSFAAIALVVFVMFQGMLLSSRNITKGIEGISYRVSCRENAIAYNIWKTGIPGSSAFAWKREMVVDNQSQYVVCGDYRQEIRGNPDERKWI